MGVVKPQFGMSALAWAVDSDDAAEDVPGLGLRPRARDDGHALPRGSAVDHGLHQPSESQRGHGSGKANGGVLSGQDLLRTPGKSAGVVRFPENVNN